MSPKLAVKETWLLFCCRRVLIIDASRPAVRARRQLLFPLTSGCLRREEGCVTPAKVADASRCTGEECLMRKGWDPDKRTQGRQREREAPAAAARSLIMPENIYSVSIQRHAEWRSRGGLKRNITEAEYSNALFYRCFKVPNSKTRNEGRAVCTKPQPADQVPQVSAK